MKRRDFLATALAGAVGCQAEGLSLTAGAQSSGPPNESRKILVGGGGFGPTFIGYLAALTGKTRPRICYLPTATGDSTNSIVRWYRNCAELDVVPFVQECFISSYSMDRTFAEVLLSMDGIVASGGNTLNQQAIWRAQGIDEVLREAWDRGIVLGGSSAGSLCWFEEGTTDSRPRELTKIECLGFLKGSHSPHYDGEAQRRPRYHELIRTGALKPGYACDNDTAIYFVDNEVRRVVSTRAGAKVYYVSVTNGEVVEEVLEPDLIGPA